MVSLRLFIRRMPAFAPLPLKTEMDGSTIWLPPVPPSCTTALAVPLPMFSPPLTASTPVFASLSTPPLTVVLPVAVFASTPFKTQVPAPAFVRLVADAA